MSDDVFVQLLRKHGPNGILLPFDVDLTLRDTMATDTPPHQHSLMTELFCRTAGGVLIMTGRSSSSVDKTLSGELPGSFEHHSAMRLYQGKEVVALAPEVDTSEIATTARGYINGSIPISSSPQEVRESEGKMSAVYPEVKRFAVALVHSLGHDKVETDRSRLQFAAKQTIDELGIDESHKVAVGSDAIEIVPKGLARTSLARNFLAAVEIERLEKHGLNKAVGLHNFMSIASYADRTPYVIGDSGTDGVAMIAATQYGGGGVWVKNGKDVPTDYTRAVNGRQIGRFMDTWKHIGEAVQYLRDHATIVVLPRELNIVAPK